MGPERLPNSMGFTAFGWASDGKVYCQHQTGLTHCSKPAPKFEVIGSGEL